MSYFLLVVTFLMSDGSREFAFEKFDTARECSQAMMAISQEIPDVTAVCREIKKGN